MKTLSVATVVPTHREAPTAYEEVGLRRCADVLNHPIILVTPESLSIRAYEKILPIRSHIRVDDYWMSSLQNYNRMMISGHLFSQLGEYSHILIHEPDAILLHDALEHWCKKPFDYVGAPWFTESEKGSSIVIDKVPNLRLLACGNSGLSLIRLSAFSRLQESRVRWYPWKTAAKDLFKGAAADASRLKKGMQALGPGGQVRGAWRIYNGNCDIFWSFVLSNTKDKLRIPNPAAALAFAWETQPQECSKLNGGRVPMGLHAWWKYDPDFVIPLLRDQGIRVPNDLPFHNLSQNTSPLCAAQR